MLQAFKNIIANFYKFGYKHKTNTQGVTMMINRKGFKSLSVLLISISLVGMATAYAGDDSQASMTTQELTALIKQIDTQNNLQIAATPEVLATLNHIMSLERLDQHKNSLQTALRKNSLPEDLLVLPLLEPQNHQVLSKTSLRKLNTLYNHFQNWKLALIAYKYGAAQTNNLIDATGSHDAWEIARAAHTPQDVKKYLALFDASVIILHNPQLVAGS
jgi:hypothetical protein